MLIKYNEFHKAYEFQEREVVGLPSGEVIVMSQQQISFFKARDLIKYRDKLKLPNGEIKIFENYIFRDDDRDRIMEFIDAITWNR